MFIPMLTKNNEKILINSTYVCTVSVANNGGSLIRLSNGFETEVLNDYDSIKEQLDIAYNNSFYQGC
jgi:hypothetical protein